MDIKPFYRLPNKDLWQGRPDGQNERIFQNISLTHYDAFLTADISPSVVLLGFACDEGVKRNQGRVGAKEGPSHLRRSLGNLPRHGELLNLSLIDLGDIVCDENLEAAQAALGNVVQTIVEKGSFPLLLGGGHETAWGHYLGLAKKFEKMNFAVVNFDAHFDMRPLCQGNRGTSGTAFLQMAEDCHQKSKPFHYYCVGIKESSNTQSLFQTAKAWGVNYLTCDECYQSPNAISEFLKRIISKHDALYVSVCLDVFAACYAPGVSASSPFGMQPWQVISALRQLAASHKVMALDVVELLPLHDKGGMTAKLGALCIAEFLYHFSAKGTT